MRGYLFLVCFAALSSGIIIGKWLCPIYLVIICIFTVVLLLILKKRDSPSLFLVFIIVLFLIGGALLSSLVFHGMKNGVVPRKAGAGMGVAIEGKVKSYPVDFSDCTSFVVQCRSIESRGKVWRTHERLNVVVRGNDRKTTVYPGLDLKIEGRVVVREGSMGWLSTMGAVAELSARPGSLRIVDSGGRFACFTEKLRNRLEEGIDKVFAQRASGMVKGFSLGSMTELDPATRDDLNGSGLSHIVAVSGMHIASTAAIITFLFGSLGLGRKAGFSAAVIFAVVIIAISGFRPSAVRSLIMVFACITGELLGRRHDAYTGLSLAGIIILSLNPRALFDLGFQFSFAAVIGIFAVTGRIKRIGMARGLVAVWAGAQIGILPVMLLHSRQVPVASLPPNIFAVPFFGPALLISLCAAALSFISVPVGRLIARPAAIYTNSLLSISSSFSAMPKARISWFVPGAALLVFCLSLFMIARAVRKGERLIKPLSVMFCSLLILYLPGQFTNQFSTADRLVVLDVGQGDAILIQDSAGVSVLVDGGPDGELIIEKLHRYGIRKIDLVVLTHAHQDHLAGLVAVIRKIPVGTILESPPGDASSPLYREFRDESDRKGIKRTMAEAGQVIDLSSHCSLNVLYPDAESEYQAEDLNNGSIVIMCRLEKARALLMGDAEIEAQGIVMKENDDLDCEVLKVPHQGSSDSASPEFIEQCRPEFAVISVGAGNEYGHPSKECIDLLDKRGVKTFRTDKMGDIVISVEKGSISVRSERGG